MISRRRKAAHPDSFEAPPVLDAAGVVDIETEVGTLFLHSEDRVMTQLISENKIWEVGETRFFQRTLEAGHVFLDCGANVGYFSVLGSKLVGPGGRVYAVEPEPANLSLLRANLWRNSSDNVTVLPVAAWSGRGFLKFHFNQFNRGDHQVEPVEEATGHVPCARIDDLLAGVDVDIAKVDVQGVDHEVIAGMSGILPARRPISILVEFWLDGLASRAIDPIAILNQYRSYGFEINLLNDEGVAAISSNDAVIEACEAWQGRFVNLVLTRG